MMLPDKLTTDSASLWTGYGQGGESKEKFHYDLWAKQIAPSSKLRQWYHADMENRWDEFKTKYTQELSCNPATTEPVSYTHLRAHETSV